MAVSGTSSNRFMAEFDKKLPEGQEAGIRVYKMPAGMTKIFTFMTTVTIDNQTVVVNKKSLEKFMDRHGEKNFHCEKKTADQLGAMLKSILPQFKPEKDSTLKMLAAMGKDDKGIAVEAGTIRIKSDKLDSFVNQLTTAGIRVPASWVSKLKEQFKGQKNVTDVEITGGQLKELQQLAEKMLQDVPADKSWATKMKGETAGQERSASPVVKKFNFKHEEPAERIKELMMPANAAVLKSAKFDPADAKAILDKISADRADDQETCLDGAAIVLKGKDDSALEVLAQLRAKAKG